MGTLRILLRGLAVSATFLAALLAGLVVHLDLPVARRILVQSLNAVLDGVIGGQIRIQRIDHLSIHSASGIRAEFVAPDGERAIWAEGISGSWSPLGVVAQVLAGEGLTVDRAAIAYAEVLLTADDTGVRLARTFVPPEDGTPSGPPGAPFVLTFERVFVEHVWAHGMLAGALVDADVDRVSARLTVDAESGEMALAVERATVNVRHAPYDPQLSALVSGRLWVVGDALAADAEVRGTVAAAPLAFAGSYRGDGIALDLDLDAVAPEELDRRFGWAPQAPLSARFFARGPLERLETELSLVLAHGAFDLRGRLNAHSPSGRLTGAVTDLDLQAIHADSPPSRLGGQLEATLALVGGVPEGSVAVALPANNELAGQLLPAVRSRARLLGEQIAVDAHIDEPGARTAAQATLERDLGGVTVDGSLSMPDLSLQHLRLVSEHAAGRGRLDAAARIRVEDHATTVDGHLDLALTGVRASGLSAHGLQLRADVSGPIRAPRARASARLQGIDTPAGRYANAQIVATGEPRRFELQASVSGGQGPIRSVFASAGFDLRERLSIRSPRARADTTFGELRARAERVTVGEGVRVDDVVVDGALGVVRGSFSANGARQTVELRGDALDLGALPLDGFVDGRVTFIASFERAGRRIDGSARLAIEDGRYGSTDGIHGWLSATLDGRKARLYGAVRAQEDAVLEIDADVATDRDWLSLAALRRLTGRARILVAADLVHADRWASELGIDTGISVAGNVALVTSLERVRADAPPDIQASLYGKGIEARPRAPQFLQHLPDYKGPVWQVDGLSGQLRVGLVAETGDAEIEARVSDVHGTLLWVDGDGVLPYATLWRNDLEVLRTRAPLSWLETAPMNVWVQLDRRKLTELPQMFRTQGLEGEIEISAYIDGNLREPRAGLKARGFGVQGGLIPLGTPMDGAVEASWKGRRVDGRIELLDATRQLLVGHVQIDTDLAALLHGRAPDEPWRADAQLSLCDFPLEAVSEEVGQGMKGRLRGNVAITDLNRPSVSGEALVSVEQLRVGAGRYDAVTVSAKLDHDELNARATIAQGSGGATLIADVPLGWQEGLPSWTGEGARIELTANELQLAFLQPFVADVLAEVDGKLDGKAALELGANPSVSGALELREGTAQIVGFGDEISDIHAAVTIHGDGKVELKDFRATSGGGTVAGAGKGNIANLKDLVASMAFRIDEDAPFPVLLDGVHLGDLSGDLTVTARLNPERLHIVASVPKLFFELPRNLPDDIQSLEPAKHIRIGTEDRGEFVPLLWSAPERVAGGRDLAMLVEVKLGKDVSVVRGDQLEVWLRGSPRFEITDRVRAKGAIDLVSGTVRVQGKPFEIVEGKVTFDGRPPSDPQVVVTASWQAPDGTTVFADYVGPVTTGKVSLRSNPPLSKSGILSLLAFGDADYELASDDSSDSAGAGAAAGVGGEVAAEGLNETLDDLSPLDLTARVDTSRGNPATELEWRVARELALSISHVIGLPNAGDPPDRNYATIDWQFARRWSFETSVGDQGSTSLDVIWTLAY